MNALIALAGLNGLIAVAASAAGAHMLKSRLDAQAMDWFLEAARFQLLHALLLLGVGVLAATGMGSRLTTLAGWLVVTGIILFSGSLYWLAFTGPGGLGSWHWVTPLGGIALMLGWASLMLAGVKGLT